MDAFTAVTVISALVSVGSMFFALRSARVASESSGVARRNADELVLMHGRLDILGDALRRVEGRITKNKALETPKPSDPDAEPDAKQFPQEWKKWQDRRIALRRGLSAG